MNNFTIYDKSGVSYFAELIDDIPTLRMERLEILLMFPFFSFQTKVISPHGEIYWHLNGEMHRLDGPALEHPNGEARWGVKGNLHRTDGPAVIHANGTREWWIEGIEYPNADSILEILAESPFSLP